MLYGTPTDGLDATVAISTNAGRFGNDAASSVRHGKEARRCAFCLGLLGTCLGAVVVGSRANSWCGSIDWRFAGARRSSASSLRMW